MKKRQMDQNTRTVYTTASGRLCPACGKPASECACSRERPNPQSDGIVRIRREVKGRRGKTVNTITGIPLHGEALLELAAALKKRCGTGGTAKDGVIIIQGDHRDILIAELEKKGYTVKRTGG